MRRRQLLAGLGMAATSGCLRLQTSREAEPTVREVTVAPDGKYMFQPEKLVIEPGDRVKWTWKRDNHNIVVADQPGEASWTGVNEYVDTGYTYSKTFRVTGTYDYYCEKHRSLGMAGTIVVSDQGARATATSSEPAPQIQSIRTDWPQYGFDARNSSFTDASGPASPAVAWKREFDGATAPVVSNGRLFTVSKSHLTALNATSGEVEWTQEEEYQGFVERNPTVVGGTVFVPRTGGGISAYSAVDGSNRWTTEVDGENPTTIIANDDVLVFATQVRDRIKIYCVDPDEGREVWTYQVDANIALAPALDEKHAYIPLYELEKVHAVLALNIRTGSPVWKSETVSTPTDVVVGSSRVFTLDIGGNNNSPRLFAFDKDTGEESWSLTLNEVSTVKPAIGEGLLVFPEQDGATHRLMAVDKESGEASWQVETSGSRSSPAIAGRRVYTGGENGLQVRSIDSGELLGEWTLDQANLAGGPAVTEGVVFVRGDNGTPVIYALADG